MDRITIAALIAVVASVIGSMVWDHNGYVTTRHAFALLFPLAVIAFPEVAESGFRSTLRGATHGGEGPMPGGILRMGAWVLLVAMIVAHHMLAAARLS